MARALQNEKSKLIIFVLEKTKIFKNQEVTTKVD
jgi:hypothetical protein